MKSDRHLLRGYSFGVLAAFALSLTSIFIYLISTRHGVAALLIAFWRGLMTSLVVVIFLLIFSRHSLKLSFRNFKFLTVNGLILAGFNILWTLSVVLNGPSVATLLVYSSGAFTVILGGIVFREKAGIWKIIAVLLTISGSALVSGFFLQKGSQTNFAGIIIGLGAGLAYAVYSLAGKSSIQRGISPWANVAYTFAIASIALLIIRLLPPSLMPDSVVERGGLFLSGKGIEPWMLLFILAVIPTSMGFGLYNASMKHLSAGTANLIASSEPVFTAILAWFIFSERLSMPTIAGGILILLALLLLWLGDRKAGS